MKRVLGVVAFGCALSGVDSKLVRWAPDKRERSWAPAQETLAVMPDLMNNGISPRPTAAPEAPKYNENDLLKLKRASTDNTCAYVDGDSDSSLYCPATDRCVYNSVRSVIGCCEDGVTSCPIWTTCYDRTDSSQYTSDNGLTLWCGQSSYPNCIKYLYHDSVFTGYTLYGCAVAKGTSTVYYKPTDSSSSTPATTRTSSNSIRSTSTSSSSSSGSGTVGFGGGSGTSTTDTAGTLGTSPAATSSAPSNPTPVGPIVGGVVGGVAVLGLIALGLFFLLRKKKDNPAAVAPTPPAVATAPTGPAPGPGAPPSGMYDPNGPQMVQQGQYPVAGFAPYDPRASIAKLAHAQQTVYDTTISPPGSPPPPPGSPAPTYQVATSGTQAPNSWGQTTSPANSAYAAPPPQQPYPAAQYNQGYQQPPQQSHHQGQQGQSHGAYFAELPTQRGDGEVRELA